MEQLTIRRAAAGDAPGIAAFNQDMAMETERLALDPARVLAGVAQVLADSGRGFYLLADCGNTVAGQLMITYEWSDWRNGVFWWIQSVYVRPEFRSRGVFCQLYRHVEELAAADGTVCGIRLYVENDNDRALRVYERLGMRRAAYAMYEVDFVLHREEISS